MDATMEAVIRLAEQGNSLKEIARRKICSATKARKILITAGKYTSPRLVEITKMLSDGMTVNQVASELNITVKAVNAHMPYSKGMYNAEYPSKNALKIRASRKKK